MHSLHVCCWAEQNHYTIKKQSDSFCHTLTHLQQKGVTAKETQIGVSQWCWVSFPICLLVVLGSRSIMSSLTVCTISVRGCFMACLGDNGSDVCCAEQMECLRTNWHFPPLCRDMLFCHLLCAAPKTFTFKQTHLCHRQTDTVTCRLFLKTAQTLQIPVGKC